MNFVLTGHKGLIGSVLLNRLLQAGHTPIELIDIREGRNIRDMMELKSKERVDVVFHLAAFCKIKECINEPWLPWLNNVGGVHAVMEYCRKHDVPKIVFTSSTRVLYPEKNVYTASKVYGEELVQSYGLDFSILRPSTVYAPFKDQTERVTHKFIEAAFAKKPLKIYGDKNKTLDFTYVDDFVDALLACSKEKNTIWNVGTGREVKLFDVAQYIIDNTGGLGTIEFHPPEKLQPQRVVVDTDYPCPTTMEEGMLKVINFWKALLP